jgi:hypothetical protein
MEDRLRPLVNRGEGAVLDIARDVCKATGTEAFAKIRIADAIRIDGWWPTQARFWLEWGCSHVTDLVRRTD